MAVTRLVVFGDAQAAAVIVLREALAGRSEDCTDGVTVGSLVPGDRSPETPHLPYVLVRKDTDSPHLSMGTSVVTIRVTVWHEDADAAHDLAQLCQALLVVHNGPVIRSVRPGTGPIPAVDATPEKTDLSTLTVLANIRPRAI
ncbi:hypothetical protein ACIOC1_00400 [Streptomyces sp. NPDC088197]|uniref:hypothetical protein n=1 Tax=Streptomyces sp. NPDC088197 TaxID=3365840 RepID=UPI0037F16D62